MYMSSKRRKLHAVPSEITFARSLIMKGSVIQVDSCAQRVYRERNDHENAAPRRHATVGGECSLHCAKTKPMFLI